MPAADAKVLRAAIKERSFAPAYYLYGDDDYLKDEELRRVIDAAVDPATRDFNFETLRGADVDAETLGSTVSTPPMMAERRVVVIRDVSALKKDARAMLDKYLKHPAPDLLLLLTAPSGAKVDKGLVTSTTAIEYEPLSGARIPKWIVYYVEHDLRATITEGAVMLLQEAAGTDLAQLRIELDKLASFTSGDAINEAAVSAVVGVRPGETMGDLLDAVARRDATAALGLLPNVMQQPKTSAVQMVMALTAQTLVTGWAQAARERGAHPSRLSGDLFNLLKESGSVFTGRSWGEFVATCARASEQWTARNIDDALEALLEADAALKGTRLSSDEQLLSTLVLTMCGAPSRRRAA
ncbi:MAG TPA: DNA polymerase III subunit delta [Gemmatimonadaceae bacterium]|nr:DNA polymerase III subunit delta [Gemmatimonadaceae bacterium]